MFIAEKQMTANVSRNIKNHSKPQKTSTTKLSSGYRINCAADDPAGLTISEKMREQIRGLNKASDNIEDGINYVQVADSALGEIQEILNRIRELSVKAANDTNQEIDRQAMQDEIQELSKEMNHIWHDTEFNSKKIWDTNNKDRVQIGVERLPAVTLGQNITTGTLNNTNKASIPSDGYYKINADTNGIVVTWDAYNGNSYQSKVIEWPDKMAGSHTFSLADYIDTATYPELEGLNFSYNYHVIEAATMEDVIESLNQSTLLCTPYNSVRADTYTKDKTKMNEISFSATINYSALLKSEKDFNAYDDLFIEGYVNKALQENNMIQDPTQTQSFDKWSFEFEMPNIGTVRATSSSTSYYSYWKDPDQKWWRRTEYGDYTRVFTPTPGDGSLDSVNASLENSGLDLVNDTITGGYVEVSFSLMAENSYTLDNGSNYTSVGSMTMQIRVGAEDTIESINEKLKNLSGVDIDAGDKTTNAPSYTYYYARYATAKEVEIDSPIYQSQIDLKIQSGANSNEHIPITYSTWDNTSLGVNSLSLLTTIDAGKTMESIDGAMEIVSKQRSLFGAYQNRMEHAKLNVNSEEENVSSSESRIRDTDMAKEMVHYAKSQILVQASQSFLAQTNSMAESALNLLK